MVRVLIILCVIFAIIAVCVIIYKVNDGIGSSQNRDFLAPGAYEGSDTQDQLIVNEPGTVEFVSPGEAPATESSQYLEIIRAGEHGRTEFLEDFEDYS